MSGAISGSIIGTYLSITKDEAAQVAATEKADAPTQAAVAALQKAAPTITSSTGLLNNFSALQVVLGAVGLSSASGETALLKDLLTQDPTSSTSLVQKSANQQYLAFAEAMQSVPSVQFQLGSPGNLAISTSGSYATSFTLQNTAYNSDPTKTSASNVGQQWQFVMNDGGADASVAAALTAATGGAYTYTVGDGTVSTPAGAPAVTVTTDASGNKVYTLATATDSSGKPTTQVSVVSVSVPSAATTTGAATQLADVAKAMNNAGLDASLSASGTLTVSGATLDRTGLAVYSTTVESGTAAGSTTIDLGSGATSLTEGELILDGSTVVGQVKSVDAYGNVTLAYDSAAAVAAGATLTAYDGLGVAAQATAATSTSSKVISLGKSGTYIVPGQVLRDGSKVLGTVASVDVNGNVTLAADSTYAVASGDTISVINGATMSHAAITATATTAAAAGSTTLDLGPQAVRLAAGQTLWDGGQIVGTIKSIDAEGVVTLTAPSTTAVAAGDSVLGVPPVAGATTPALSDTGNLTKIIDEYETNQFEAAQGQQNLGMQEALYYTRKIGSITSIDALMSDPTLLSVVEANLGLPTAFGELDYDQQYATLSADVKLSDFQNAAYVKSSAERYLTLVQEYNQPSSSTTTSELTLFGASSGTSGLLSLLNTSSSSSSTTTDVGAALLTALYPSSASTGLPATSGTPQSQTAILSLFA
jgi:small nuclear ribonucleoprotein (snRNP)-like protein